MLAVGGPAWGEEAVGPGGAENLEVRNQYIRIFVNTTDDGTGRYAVDSTGGDPLNPRDDDKPLVYGRPCPWTSYTTIRIDGTDHVFGGKTQRRAGKGAAFGRMVSRPQLSGTDTIVAAWEFGDVEVTQSLSIVRSTTTGLRDTARITYVVTNLGRTQHSVGLRIMLDTMLGANDGAPLRAGERAILSDAAFDQGDMPHFWQAFDSLSSPTVTSQGTLVGADATPPDRVVIMNWGSLADDPWNVEVVPGRDFTRAGEYELDSAIALYWDPAPLGPGDSREYTTLYGMGGISIAPGVLSIGVTSPAEITTGKDRPATFPIVAYVENSGPTVALNVRISLRLPDGLAMVSGDAGWIGLGDLAPGETAQAAWEVAPEAIDRAELEYSVAVEAENAEPNLVRRSVRVLAPPKLGVEIVAGRGFTVKGDAYDPYPLKVGARIRNSGGAPAYGVKATLALADGLSLAVREKAARFPAQIGPGEECEVFWQVIPAGEPGDFGYTVTVSSRSTDDVRASNRARVPALRPRVAVVAPARVLASGEFFVVEVAGRNLSGFGGIAFDLGFDPSILEAVSVSRGTVFVGAPGAAGAEWSGGAIDNAAGVVKGVRGRLPTPRDASGTLAWVCFRAKAPGTTRLALERVTFAGSADLAGAVSMEQSFVTVSGSK